MDRSSLHCDCMRDLLVLRRLSLAVIGMRSDLIAEGVGASLFRGGGAHELVVLLDTGYLLIKIRHGEETYMQLRVGHLFNSAAKRGSEGCKL